MTPTLKLRYIGYQTGFGQHPGFRIYNVINAGPTTLPVGSTISEQTVKRTAQKGENYHGRG